MASVGRPLGPAAVGVDLALQTLVAHVVGASAVEGALGGGAGVLVERSGTEALLELIVVPHAHFVVGDGDVAVGDGGFRVFQVLENAAFGKESTDGHGVHDHVFLALVAEGNGAEKTGSRAAVDEFIGSGLGPLAVPADTRAAVVAHEGDIASDHDVVGFVHDGFEIWKIGMGTEMSLCVWLKSGPRNSHRR